MNGRTTRDASIKNQYGPEPDGFTLDAVESRRSPPAASGPTAWAGEKKGCQSNASTLEGVVTAFLTMLNNRTSGCTFASQPSCSITGS